MSITLTETIEAICDACGECGYSEQVSNGASYEAAEHDLLEQQWVRKGNRWLCSTCDEEGK